MSSQAPTTDRAIASDEPAIMNLTETSMHQIFGALDQRRSRTGNRPDAAPIVPDGRTSIEASAAPAIIPAQPRTIAPTPQTPSSLGEIDLFQHRASTIAIRPRSAIIGADRGLIASIWRSIASAIARSPQIFRIRST